MIIDSVEEDVSRVIVSDDGTGAGIRIPALLINKGHGDRLKKFLQDSDEEARKRTALTAEFYMTPNEDNSV